MFFPSLNLFDINHKSSINNYNSCIYIYTNIFITYTYIFINISTYLSYIYSSSIHSYNTYLSFIYLSSTTYHLLIINYLSVSHLSVHPSSSTTYPFIYASIIFHSLVYEHSCGSVFGDKMTFIVCSPGCQITSPSLYGLKQQ